MTYTEEAIQAQVDHLMGRANHWNDLGNEATDLEEKEVFYRAARHCIEAATEWAMEEATN